MKPVCPLPDRHGVSPSRVALPPGNWLTLTDFLCHRFPHVSKQQWLSRMAQHLVFKQDGAWVHPDEPYTPHQFVFYYRQVDGEKIPDLRATILFEDAHVLVADKPHFLPVTPGGRYVQHSALVQLKQVSGCHTLTPLHRLDRETAGLVVFGKIPSEREHYHALFRERLVNKTYEAVAPIDPHVSLPTWYRSRIEEDPRFFLSREAKGEPNSETLVSMIRPLNDLALYRLQPTTGKRHQLRLHMWSLGLPIVGDRFYPKVLDSPTASNDMGLPLQLLAKHIAFTDPVTGQRRSWVSQQVLCLDEGPN